MSYISRSFFGELSKPNSQRMAAIISLLFASILTVALAFSSVANAVTTLMYVVKPVDIQPISELANGSAGWYKQTAGTASVTANADQPWNGSGSAKFTVNGTSSYAELGLYKYIFANNRLANLPSLGYSTWQQSDGTKAVTLEIGIDTNVADGDISDQGRLVFNPALNTDYNYQPLQNGTWQGWVTNRPDSLWTMTWSPSLEEKYGANPCAQSSPCSYDQLLGMYPNIGFNAGLDNPLILKAGAGWTSFTGYADVPAVGTAFKQEFWDFEPSDIIAPTYPTLKDECKDDGWQNYGTLFKNQGSCVSFVVRS